MILDQIDSGLLYSGLGERIAIGLAQLNEDVGWAMPTILLRTRIKNKQVETHGRAALRYGMQKISR